MASNKPHQEADPNEVIPKADGCWWFKPKAFNIIWGNDKRYWNLSAKAPNEEGAPEDVAELVQVSWLELTASTPDNLTVGKKYEISFTITMTKGAFGWNGFPVFMMAKIGKKGKYIWTKIKLSNLDADKPHTIPKDSKFQIQVTQTGPNSTEDPDTKLYFGLYEVWGGKWKGGLQIHGARVQEATS